MKIKMKYLKETKSCYVFSAPYTEDHIALYLKKKHVDAAGIDPQNGITVTVEEGGAEA